MHKYTTPCALTFFAVAVLVVVGAFLRVYGLPEWYYSPDDVLHLSYANAESFWGAIVTVMANNAHPPGMFAVLYGMKKISDNEMFLRCISIVPGLILIPLFYQLGLVFRGRPAGLFMAYIATCSITLVILSQPIRQYMMMLCFLTAALTYLLKYTENKQLQPMFLYALCMAFAILFNYSAVILIFAIGVVWWFKIIWKQKKFKDVVVWSALHLSLAAFFALLYYFQTSIHRQGHDQFAEIWLTGAFPHRDQLFLWIVNALDITLFNFIAFEPTVSSLLVLFLTIAGWVFFLKQKQYSLLCVILLALGVNIILTGLRFYPFIGNRHCIYLAPVLLLPMAAAFQYWYEINSYARHHFHSKDIMTNKRLTLESTVMIFLYQSILKMLSRTSSSFPQLLSYIGPSFLFAAGLVLAILYAHEEDFHRISYPSNFPVTRSSYETIIEDLNHHVPKGDIVITERHYLDYCIYHSGGTIKDYRYHSSESALSDWVNYLDCDGRRFYYLKKHDAQVAFHDIHELQLFLLSFKGVMPEVKNVWFFTAGWDVLLYKLALPDLVTPIKSTSSTSSIERLKRQYDHALDDIRWGLLLQERQPKFMAGEGEALYKVSWNALEKTLLDPDKVLLFKSLSEKKKLLIEEDKNAYFP